jgi:hypothetical protein
MTRFRFSVRSLMIVVAICGLFCWPLGILAQRNIEARSEAQCSANLVEIGTAMARYEAKYGHFPPAYVTDPTGKPIHSWRALLLEFLDPPLFRQYSFGEPWNGPNNSKLASKMPGVYACPSDALAEKRKTTCYAVIVGAESAFPENRTVRIADISDRTLNIPTILVAEAADLKIPWLEPRDLRVDQMEPVYRQTETAQNQMESANSHVGQVWNDISRSGLSSRHRKGAGVYCFGGEVRRAKPTAMMGTLKNMITISGNESYCDDPY